MILEQDHRIAPMTEKQISNLTIGITTLIGLVVLGWWISYDPTKDFEL